VVSIPDHQVPFCPNAVYSAGWFTMRTPMNVIERIVRHARVSWKNLALAGPPSPPFLILFMTSLCNLACEHCFYWRNLNQRDDLTRDEILALARELGPVENLNLGGGEPFLRDEFAEICRFFITNNGVRQIYCPTSGYFTERMVEALSEILIHETTLALFAVEISLDGMPEFHNRFRGNSRSFAKALETYDELVRLQARDPRLRIHAVSTATAQNLEEIQALTTFLFERCPAMDHHNLALIRGDRKNPSLQGPDLAAYAQLYGYVRQLWRPRESGRFGAIVDPMLHWAKVRTAEERRQVIPCRAGVLSAVVYANGDVSVCETHPPLGNLRQRSFREIWWSPEASALRQSIARKECHCTNEVFLWPSIVFQPAQLVRAASGARVWRKARPGSLPPSKTD
jgi:MoaA/NifB/PqqE/SkfB family radical SAM enzyme